MTLVAMKTEFKTEKLHEDSEVAELLDRINLLHKSITDREESADIEMIAEFFEDYVKNHFREEEMLMETLYYNEEELAEHKKEHEFFIDEFAKIRSSLRDNGVEKIWDGLEEMEILLRDWMAFHMTSFDSKLDDFLKKAV